MDSSNPGHNNLSNVSSDGYLTSETKSQRGNSLTLAMASVGRKGLESEIRDAQTPQFIQHSKINPDLLVFKEGLCYVKNEGTLKLLVPHEFRERILTFIHQVGHYGRKRTYQLLRANYQWPNMHSDVVKFVACCETCQVNKKSRIPKRTWQRYPLSSRFKTVHIDLVGPLLRSRKGNQFMLTIIDRYSRWIEAVPLATIRAIDISDKFYKVWVTRYGVPDRVISDQGSQFESFIYNDLLRRLGAQHVRTTAYHPQTNGKIERAHSTIKNILRCLSSHSADWEDVLPATLMAMRVAINEDGVSPSLLVFGEHLSVPGLLVGDPATKNEEDTSEFVRKMRKHLQLLRQFVIKMHSERIADTDNKETRKFPYKNVWLLDPLLKNSLSPKYNGPYRVVSTDQYPVLQIDIDGVIKRVTVDRLKPAPHLAEMTPFTWHKDLGPAPPPQAQPGRHEGIETVDDIIQGTLDAVPEEDGPPIITVKEVKLDPVGVGHERQSSLAPPLMQPHNIPPLQSQDVTRDTTRGNFVLQPQVMLSPMSQPRIKTPNLSLPNMPLFTPINPEIMVDLPDVPVVPPIPPVPLPPPAEEPEVNIIPRVVDYNVPEPRVPTPPLTILERQAPGLIQGFTGSGRQVKPVNRFG
jgi:hypothetical protein